MRPDPLFIRESLRLVRHVLRRGGRSLREALPAGELPRPAGALVGSVLGEAESLARSVERVGSAVLGGALGGPAARGASWSALRDGRIDPPAFAATYYGALRRALARLGVGDAFVSEARIRRAVAESATPRDARATDAALAAALTLALLDARVVWTDVAGFAPARAEAVSVALFAVQLAMLTRADPASDETLAAALGLASAIEGEIDACLRARDVARLEGLYAEFVAHV